MSAGVLRYTLVVRHPETDEPTALLVGKRVPKWAADMVHPDDLEGGDTDASASSDPDKGSGSGGSSSSSKDGGQGDNGSPEPVPPPKGGAGSGADEWRKYCAAVGVEVPEDASREDCITALEAAGKPTESAPPE